MAPVSELTPEGTSTATTVSAWISPKKRRKSPYTPVTGRFNPTPNTPSTSTWQGPGIKSRKVSTGMSSFSAMESWSFSSGVPRPGSPTRITDTGCPISLNIRAAATASAPLLPSPAAAKIRP